MEVQQVIEKSCCNEAAANIKLKCIGIFTGGLPEKLYDFSHRPQVKHTYFVIEPSTPFHTLVKAVEVEDVTNEKLRTLDQPLEIRKMKHQNWNLKTYPLKHMIQILKS